MDRTCNFFAQVADLNQKWEPKKNFEALIYQSDWWYLKWQSDWKNTDRVATHPNSRSRANFVWCDDLDCSHFLKGLHLRLHYLNSAAALKAAPRNLKFVTFHGSIRALKYFKCFPFSATEQFNILWKWQFIITNSSSYGWLDATDELWPQDSIDNFSNCGIVVDQK